MEHTTKKIFKTSKVYIYLIYIYIYIYIYIFIYPSPNFRFGKGTFARVRQYTYVCCWTQSRGYLLDMPSILIGVPSYLQ